MKENQKDTIVIIGAGPAGLTAAYELATRANYKLIVLEAGSQVGGISKTVDYKGNKIDIGGHRFFSKSDWVLEWWQKFLPVFSNSNEISTTYQNQNKMIKIRGQMNDSEPHMMVRPRKSRIFHNKKLLDYPLKLNLNTLRKIGILKSLKIFISILYIRIKPIKNEDNLEDFYINRFGKELYRTFFKEYTMKVWGKPCHEISAEWGRQRVQSLGIRKILKHYFTTFIYPQRNSFANSQTERTLTEYFLYPQQGPGQLWEKVAASCKEQQVDFQFNQKAVGMVVKNSHISEIKVVNSVNGTTSNISCSQVISTMPVKNLIRSLGAIVPKPVQDIASSLEYRDFLIVGLLLSDLKLMDVKNNPINDNWIYIQESGVSVGRVQLFHNWSPQMVSDNKNCWIGAEYFCQKGDRLWNKSNADLIGFASKELSDLGLIDDSKVLDGTVVRMPKAYPSYVGSYQYFDQVKKYLNSIGNIYPIGRNGTHRYNNQDHSMLSANEAVNTIIKRGSRKEHLWNVNSEQTYHEKAD